MRKFETKVLFRINLSRVLKEKRISIKQLAEKTGFCIGTVYTWSSGRYFPSANDIDIICDCLGISQIELFKE